MRVNGLERFGAYVGSALVLLTVGSLAQAGETAPPVIGRTVRPLTLPDAAGQAFSLDRLKGKKASVVVFLSFDCPVSTSYMPTLDDLARQYADRDVAVVGIVPGEEEGQARQHAQEYHARFPLLRDEKFAATAAFGADVTPQAFLLDSQLTIRYCGRIDDGYVARLKKKGHIAHHDLREALDEVLAAKTVSHPTTAAIGCPIVAESAVRKTTGAVTFNRDVLPILQEKCQSCHRPGESAPFSLLTYPQAVRWAQDIKDYTQTRKMPPWKPVESHGVFQNERKLSDEEIGRLARWVDGGMPEGDPHDKPAPRRWPEGWQLGEPDLILEPPEDVVVGATGSDMMRVIAFPTHFTEEKYLAAIEVQPGNRRVVHHTLFITDTTGKGRRYGEEERRRVKKPDEPDQGPGYSTVMGLGFIALPPKVMLLGGWAPGLLPRPLPEGVGYRVPKGADILVQIHYHRTGKVERDRTRVGLHFAKKPVTRPLQILGAPGLFAMIPAREPHYKIEGRIWMTQDITIYSVMPHMHLLGKDIKATLTLPDGTVKPLVWIPDWDFNWQEYYYFKEPLHAPAGSHLDIVAYYDNSEGNPQNPNQPPRAVFLGEETTNEMCLVFLGCTADRPGPPLLPYFAEPKLVQKRAARE
jgi:peroxiredoxin